MASISWHIQSFLCCCYISHSNAQNFCIYVVLFTVGNIQQRVLFVFEEVKKEPFISLLIESKTSCLLVLLNYIISTTFLEVSCSRFIVRNISLNLSILIRYRPYWKQQHFQQFLQNFASYLTSLWYVKPFQIFSHLKMLWF